MSDTATVDWVIGADSAGIADFLQQKLAGGGFRHIAVPGGSTPGPIFAELAKRDLDWQQLQFILTDDRQVPPDHQASNLRVLRETLGDTGAQIMPLYPEMAPPHFDLTWLGMGADGHIASLFPQMQVQDMPVAAVIETVPEPLPPEAPFPRLSLNMPALLASDAIMLVMKGADKKQVIDAAIAGEHDLPIAQLLKRAHCPVTIFWSET